MKPRAFTERARRVIERLDERLERQTFGKGADAVHVVSVAGVFHRAAGQLESDLENPRVSKANIATMLRVLHRIVDSHRVMVLHRGALLRKAESERPR